MLQNFYQWRVGGCWYNVSQCPNALYGRVQKAWYLKVEEKVRGILMKLWEIFEDTVVKRKYNKILADGAGKGADGFLTAWDAISGRIAVFDTPLIY